MNYIRIPQNLDKWTSFNKAIDCADAIICDAEIGALQDDEKEEVKRLIVLGCYARVAQSIDMKTWVVPESQRGTLAFNLLEQAGLLHSTAGKNVQLIGYEKANTNMIKNNEATNEKYKCS